MRKILIICVLLLVKLSYGQNVPVTNGLVAHFDDVANNYSVTGNTAIWTDNISNIQASISNASLIPTTTNVNGHVGLVFNINEYLATPMLSDFNSPSPTIIVVKRGAINNYLYTTVASLSTGNSQQECFLADKAAFHSNSSGNFIYKQHQCVDSLTSPDSSFMITAASFSGTKNVFDYYLNGVKSTDAMNLYGTTFDNSVTNRMLGIGYRINWYSNEKYKGEIYEVLIYNYKLSDVEMADVTNYLICKYEITGNFCDTKLNCENREDPNDEDPNDEDPNDPKSLNDIKFSKYFDIYPNPATDLINIENKTNEIMDISMYDLTGRQFVSRKINRNDVLDISKLTAGTYIIKIGNNDMGYYFKKIIKQ